MSVESLYPFLYEGAGAEDVMAQATRSTVAKVEDIARLRADVAARYGAELGQCAAAMKRALDGGARVFTFGNGGSSTDAADIAHLFVHPPHGRPYPSACLTEDVAVLTALANDVGFDVVFARQLAAFGRSGDVAIGVSTSGGSANVLRAFEQATRIGMLTVGLAGYDGGPMAEAANAGTIDHLFVIPSASVHRIQEAQTTVYHVLWTLTQEAL